jgi:hypothetical protein
MDIAAVITVVTAVAPARVRLSVDWLPARSLAGPSPANRDQLAADRMCNGVRRIIEPIVPRTIHTFLAPEFGHNAIPLIIDG